MAMTVAAKTNSTQAFITSVSLYVHDCPTCGVTLAITQQYRDERIEDGKSWYCPNGHTLGYQKSEAERVRAELARVTKLKAQEVALRESYQAWLRDERKSHQATERQLRATRGVVTRQRNRAAAALCPVDGCGRSFVQMRRHLAAKHPDFPA